MWITYTTYQHYQQLDIRGLRFEDGLNWVIHRLGGLSTSYAHRFGSYPQRVNLWEQCLQHVRCYVHQRSEIFRELLPALTNNHGWYVVFSVLADSEVFHIPVIAGDDDQPIVIVPGIEQSSHHSIEQFQNFHAAFERPTMPDLIGDPCRE